MRLSVIIPVFDRPEELEELLESLTAQDLAGVELIVVEDGSRRRSDAVVERYRTRLPITYHYKTNSGPGPSRNVGAELAQGRHLLFLDSDCILPAGQIQHVLAGIDTHPDAVFGGPDRAHGSFTPLQKAIDHAMTSMLTTGGVRGGGERMERFHPRSFNMGCPREAFRAVGGFGDLRFGEDIDLSIRLHAAGHPLRLFPDTWVYHKRRSTLRSFFRQVYNSGLARWNLRRLHPGSMRPVHWLPTCFTVGSIALVVASFFKGLSCLAPLGAFTLALMVDGYLRHGKANVALLAVLTGFTQLFGYGSGFLDGLWSIGLRGRVRRGAFLERFYDK